MYQQAEPVRVPLSGPGRDRTGGPPSQAPTVRLRSGADESTSDSQSYENWQENSGAPSNLYEVAEAVRRDVRNTTADTTYPGKESGRRTCRSFLGANLSCVAAAIAIVVSLVAVGLTTVLFVNQEEMSQLTMTADALSRNLDNISRLADSLDALKRFLDNERNRTDVLEQRLTEMNKPLDLSKNASAVPEQPAKGPKHTASVPCVTSDQPQGNQDHSMSRTEAVLRDSKKITFPNPRNTANYARLGTTLHQDLNTFTLCLHMRTDMDSSMPASLVSYATVNSDNELLLYNNAAGFKLFAAGRSVHGPSVSLTVWDGMWHEICATWRNTDGAWELYVDGVLKESGSGLSAGDTVRSGGTWILAQDQDTVGGGFGTTQAFSGEMSHVNLWDRVLSPAEIGSDWTVFCSRHGNVIDWSTTDIDVFGQANGVRYLHCGKNIISATSAK